MQLLEAIIYTDGSVDHVGNGGWACVVATPYAIYELSDAEDETTNNRMEMLAAIKGMEFLTEPHKVMIVSDSAYLLNTIKNRWFDKWFEKEARTNNEYTRPNMDLWHRIADLVDFHDVVTVKVKGHDGVYLNEQVDKLAVKTRMTKEATFREMRYGYREDDSI